MKRRGSGVMSAPDVSRRRSKAKSKSRKELDRLDSRSSLSMLRPSDTDQTGSSSTDTHDNRISHFEDREERKLRHRRAKAGSEQPDCSHQRGRHKDSSTALHSNGSSSKAERYGRSTQSVELIPQAFISQQRSVSFHRCNSSEDTSIPKQSGRSTRQVDMTPHAFLSQQQRPSTIAEDQSSFADDFKSLPIAPFNIDASPKRNEDSDEKLRRLLYQQPRPRPSSQSPRLGPRPYPSPRLGALGAPDPRVPSPRLAPRAFPSPRTGSIGTSDPQQASPRIGPRSYPSPRTGSMGTSDSRTVSPRLGPRPFPSPRTGPVAAADSYRPSPRLGPRPFMSPRAGPLGAPDSRTVLPRLGPQPLLSLRAEPVGSTNPICSAPTRDVPRTILAFADIGAHPSRESVEPMDLDAMTTTSQVNSFFLGDELDLGHDSLPSLDLGMAYTIHEKSRSLHGGQTHELAVAKSFRKASLLQEGHVMAMDPLSESATTISSQLNKQYSQMETPDCESRVNLRRDDVSEAGSISPLDLGAHIRSIEELDLSEVQIRQEPVAPLFDFETHHIRKGSQGSYDKVDLNIDLLVALSAARRGSMSSSGNDSLGDATRKMEMLQSQLTRNGSLRSLVSSEEATISLMNRSLNSNISDFPFPGRQVTRSNSIGSLGTTESSLFDAFYDPSGDSPPYLTIYYATQSGTSEYYAYCLQQEGRTMGLDVGICNVSVLMRTVNSGRNLRDILIPHHTKLGRRRGRAVFLMSTYTGGGPTEDGEAFFQCLRSIAAKQYLKGLRYAVFGFGNSAYATSYNAQGIVYDQLFEALGGRRLVPLGLGDSSNDIDWDFEQWKWKAFWPKVAELSIKDRQSAQLTDGEGASQVPTKEEIISNGRRSVAVEHDGPYVLEYIDPMDGTLRDTRLAPTSRHRDQGNDYTVAAIQSLWNEKEGQYSLQGCRTIHLELDVTGNPSYCTGDVVSLMPNNQRAIVDAVATKLGYDLASTFILSPSQESEDSEFESPFPCPCTVREYLTRYCELVAPPRRSAVSALSKFATNFSHREEMYSISSNESRDEYMSRIVQKKIGMADLVTTVYPSIQIPLVSFIRLCAPLQPRWYSISSSSSMHPGKLHLTFSVLTIPRPIGDLTFYGLCSNYMMNLSVGDSCHILKTVPSELVAPSDYTKPLIMIANGAGIAPMRALVQERHFQRTHQKCLVGPNELYFGIRNRDLDFLYREEWEMYQEQDTLSALYLACSREQSHKVYVQHLVAKNAEHVWKLMQRGAHIYVCGSSAMHNDVDKVLRAIVSRQLGTSKLDDYMEKLRDDKRYVHESFDSYVK